MCAQFRYLRNLLQSKGSEKADVTSMPVLKYRKSRRICTPPEWHTSLSQVTPRICCWPEPSLFLNVNDSRIQLNDAQGPARTGPSMQSSFGISFGTEGFSVLSELQEV